MQTQIIIQRRRGTAAALALLALPLAGCGAGNSNNPNTVAGSGTSAPLILTGTVLDSSGAAVSGDTVEFDRNSAVAGTTNSQGQFTLTVPLADVTGSDMLSVLSGQGAVLQIQSVTTSNGPVTITLPAVPAPPTNLNPPQD